MGERYGCLSFLLDVFLVLFTGGLWLIWIIIREIRKSSKPSVDRVIYIDRTNHQI